MSLKHMFFALMLSAAVLLIGCASTENQSETTETSEQAPMVAADEGTTTDKNKDAYAEEPAPSKQVEKYYLKPASGEDASRIDTVEKEVIAARKARDAAANERHLIDYEIVVAKEDLAHEQDKDALLTAEYSLAAAKDSQAEVNKVKSDRQIHEVEIAKKECVLDYLSQKKAHGGTTLELRDAQLATKVAERNYLMAKVARENQDKQLGKPENPCEEDISRIDVSYYEKIWKRKQAEEKIAQNMWNESSTSLEEARKACDSAGTSTTK